MIQVCHVHLEINKPFFPSLIPIFRNTKLIVVQKLKIDCSSENGQLFLPQILVRSPQWYWLPSAISTISPSLSGISTNTRNTYVPEEIRGGEENRLFSRWRQETWEQCVGKHVRYQGWSKSCSERLLNVYRMSQSHVYILLTTRCQSGETVLLRRMR